MNWLKLLFAQRNALVLHFGALVLPCVLLAACIYVPPVWDAYDEIGYVGSIEQGVTTRKEVLEKLGEPDSKDKEERTFSYHGMASAGAMCIGGGYQAACGLIKEERWWITIYFDDQDVVSGVASSKEPGKARILRARQKQQKIAKLREMAEKGDADAQYQLAFEIPLKSAERWVWLCRAANQSHKSAQYGLGGMLITGSGAVPQDEVAAYMWLSLAKSNDNRFAEDYLQAIAKDMTPAEIAEAERLVSEWKPDPASCEVEAVQLEN